MNLPFLEPDLQAQFLALRVPPGREPFSARDLRHALATPLWADQRASWAELRPTE